MSASTSNTQLGIIPVVTPENRKNKRARIVAKHAPKRTSSRFYTQVRAINIALEEAVRVLGRAELSNYRKDQIDAKIKEYRQRLTEVRQLIPVAVTKWHHADEVKEELKALAKLTRALPDVITDLSLQEKAVASRKYDLEDAEVIDVLQTSTQVVAALEDDQPGALTTRSKRLRKTSARVLN